MRPPNGPARAAGWLFCQPAAPERLLVVQAGLAVVIGLRIALGPYRALAGQPPALFRPPLLLALLPAMPPLWAIGLVQLVGTAAAWAAAVGWRRRWAFAAAWFSLLFLAGLRTSLGKVLHNDALLILVALPFLAAPTDARRGGPPSPRYGWPLWTAMAVTAGAYFFAGYHKLVSSGLAWVAPDNMVNVAYASLLEGRAPTRWPAELVAARPWVATATAVFILTLELSFPVVLVRAGLRPLYLCATVVLHAVTWAALGLDYWAWVAVVALVLPDWKAWRRPPRPGQGQVDGVGVISPSAPDIV